MKIGLIGSEIHAGQMNKMLKNSVLLATNKKQPSIFNFINELKKCDVVYIIGFFIPKYSILACLFGKKVIVHWIGTDVLNLHNFKIRLLYKTLLNGVDINLCGAVWLKKELKTFEINAKYIPLITKDVSLKLEKNPKKHAVLCYVPKGRETFYGFNKIKKIAKRHPFIPFFIVPYEKENHNYFKNIRFLGRIKPKDMNSLYSKITVLLRPTQHDGLSMMILEALGKGKQVCWTYGKYISGCNSINDVDKILKKKPKLNKKGSKYVKEKFNKKKIISEIEKVIENVYRSN